MTADAAAGDRAAPSASADDHAAEATRRRDARAAEAARLATAAERVARARLAIALAGLGLGIVAGATPWLLLPVVVFVVLVVHHGDVRARQDRAARAAAFWSRSLARMDGSWIADAAAAGSGAAPPGHPYADDLDCCGSRSLHALLTTARTRAGGDTLAAWLLAPAAPDVVAARQAAVAELAPRLDLREALALAGDDVAGDVDAPALARWAAGGTGGAPAALRVALVLLAAAAAVGVALAALGHALPVAVVLVVEGAVAAALHRRVRAARHGLDVAGRELVLLAELLALLEAERFAAPRLVALRAALDVDGRPPSALVQRLRRLVVLLDARGNQLFAPIGWLLLWTTQVSLAIAAWRAECGPAIVRWLDAVAEMEALASLAAAAWEHPAWTFPSVAAGPADFAADDLVHPLLAPGRAVPNDVRLAAGGPRLLVVSGSNMSGKSTLLRAVGVAAVLAQAGSAVPARRLRLSPLAVGAAIRLRDSLQDGTSRFYAELARVKQIVDLATARPPALFLLDELFAGTNSHDRRVGAEAVVRALLAHDAIGLLTTHDLALARLGETTDGSARNVHFEDRWSDGRLAFDYRLRDGVVTRTNALDLMRAVGLDVPDD